jgi:hypothetical protein
MVDYGKVTIPDKKRLQKKNPKFFCDSLEIYQGHGIGEGAQGCVFLG